MAGENQYARYHYRVPKDSMYDLRCDRARAGNRSDFEEFQRLSEENGIQECYRKGILLSLVTVDGTDDPQKEIIGTHGVNEQRWKCSAHKRKGNYNIMAQDDDWHVEEEEEEDEEECDPEYELVLKHLEEMDESSKHKFERGLLPLCLVLKSEDDMEDNWADIVQIDEHRFYHNTSRMNHWVAEGLRESVHPAQTCEKNKAQDRGKLKEVSGQGDLEIIKKRKKHDSFNVISDESSSHPVKTRKPMKGIHFQTERVAEGLRESVHPVQTREKNKAHDRVKLKEVAGQGDLEINKKRKKPDRINVISDESSSRQPMKGIHCQTGKAKCAKCSMPLKKSDGKCWKGERNSKTVPSEVEILDSDMVRKGMFRHFVPADNFVTDEDLRLPRVSGEYRKDVMKLLKKPYNKEEYHKGRAKIRDGSYTLHYPDVQRKLTKYRYNPKKRLLVVRGFLFWLKNMTREGSFEPWKDKECLAVELP